LWVPAATKKYKTNFSKIVHRLYNSQTLLTTHLSSRMHEGLVSHPDKFSLLIINHSNTTTTTTTTTLLCDWRRISAHFSTNSSSYQKIQQEPIDRFMQCFSEMGLWIQPVCVWIWIWISMSVGASVRPSPTANYTIW
jgi:hypothetical protein